jgi:hypothetical protein
MDAAVQVCEVGLESFRVILPHRAIHARRGGLLQTEEPRPQNVDADVVKERRQLLPFVPGDRLSYAGLRL